MLGKFEDTSGDVYREKQATDLIVDWLRNPHQRISRAWERQSIAKHSPLGNGNQLTFSLFRTNVRAGYFRSDSAELCCLSFAG
jgi:hypothetical protein